MLRAFHTSRYYAEIGEGHVFPMRKFALVRERLLGEGTLRPDQIAQPQLASISDVLLVHTEDYVMRLRAGALTSRELRRLGLPWSKSLVRRSFLATGGTIGAAGWALRNRVGSNIAGGTHHSFPDRGEGFCVLNDVAVAIRVLQRDRLIRRAAIIDCDVHQGNGTATIFAEDSDVFTFSMHGAKNYPLFKVRSSLDVELPDNTTDAVYNRTLAEHLPQIFAHQPDIIFYLGGADPFVGDKLGRLALSIPGLRRRDELILRYCQSQRVPVVTVLSGGYAADTNDTVEIHCNTIRAAQAVFAGDDAVGAAEAAAVTAVAGAATSLQGSSPLPERVTNPSEMEI